MENCKDGAPYDFQYFYETLSKFRSFICQEREGTPFLRAIYLIPGLVLSRGIFLADVPYGFFPDVLSKFSVCSELNLQFVLNTFYGRACAEAVVDDFNDLPLSIFS